MKLAAAAAFEDREYFQNTCKLVIDSREKLVAQLLMAVLLFSPTIVDPVKTQFAPAVAITALDLVLHVGNNAWRAISDLFMYTMIAFGVYIVFVLIRWPIERAANARRERKAAVDAALAAETVDEHDEPFSRPAPASGMRVEPRL